MDCCKLRILSQHACGFIGVRCGHDLVHLRFNNILLNFSYREFEAFRRITKSLDINQSLVQFPDGSKKVILFTPYKGINFSFSPLELQNLVNLMDEAYYFGEVYALLNGNS